MEVGDGWQVKVWEDKWQTAEYMPKPISPKLVNCEVKTVAYLRSRRGNGWDRRML